MEEQFQTEDGAPFGLLCEQPPTRESAAGRQRLLNIQTFLLSGRSRKSEQIGDFVFAVHRRAVRGIFAMLASLILTTSCQTIRESLSVSPRALRDVPAARLAFRLEPDISQEVLPESVKNESAAEPLAAIKADFESRRGEQALLSTVVSPDGQRALALYDPGNISEDEFKIDLYSSDGRFLRNVLPDDLSGVSMLAVNWSPDGQWIAFVGRRPALAVATATPVPTPPEDIAAAAAATDPNASPTTAPTVGPLIAPVPAYTTEQVYLADRDGFNLRPLTTRDGLIYFHLAWAPDNHAVAALACREAELTARLNDNKPLAGRPRVIDREGNERLLDDQLMDAFPVWSPDAAKIATAADTNVFIYDATATEQPTGARISLREPLLTASAAYDERVLTRRNNPTSANKAGQTVTASSSNSLPLSFNPAVRLEWVQPEVLLVQTGFVRIYQNNESVSRYLRWHVLHLSPQAVVLKQ